MLFFDKGEFGIKSPTKVDMRLNNKNKPIYLHCVFIIVEQQKRYIVGKYI